jgi:hypothetical protein
LANLQNKQYFNLRCHWHRTTLSLRSRNASLILALMHIIARFLAYPSS